MHKGKISKIMQYLPFVFMGIMMCIIHSRIGLDTADDVWFENQVKAPGFNLGQWLYIRYYIWSSRTIIEAIMLIVLSLPQLIWRILDSAMFVLTAMFMSKNFCTEEHIVLKNWLIVFLNLTVNLKVMSEAGWGSCHYELCVAVSYGAGCCIFNSQSIRQEKNEGIGIYRLFYLPVVCCEYGTT